MTHGSLFAGTGGFDLGFAWAGIETIWQVEIDDYCRQVLAQHFPEAERFSDIRECGAHNLKPVDIISGGVPCQPTSFAGSRRGDKDSRWLWPQMRRVVSDLRSTWVICENPPGIITMGLDNVLSDLESIGYAWRAFNIPACSVGAYHIRERVLIVAHLDSEGASQQKRTEQNERGRLGNIHKETDEPDSGETRLQGRGKTRALDRDAENIQQGDRSSFNSPGFISIHNRNPKPFVGGGLYGIPSRVDRLKGLGNAIVPQIAEIIGRRLMEIEA